MHACLYTFERLVWEALKFNLDLLKYCFIFCNLGEVLIFVIIYVCLLCGQFLFEYWLKDTII